MTGPKFWNPSKINETNNLSVGIYRVYARITREVADIFFDYNYRIWTVHELPFILNRPIQITIKFKLCFELRQFNRVINKET